MRAGTRVLAWPGGVGGAARGAVCTAVATAACLALLGGCTANLQDLRGGRVAFITLPETVGTAQPGTAHAGAAQPGTSHAVPANYVLRNDAWGPVRVESARVPVGTEISTTPPLPCTVKPGESLTVRVVSRFRPGAAPAARTIWLETKGAESLALVIEPVPPVPTAPPVAPAAPAVPAAAAPASGG